MIHAWGSGLSEYRIKANKMASSAEFVWKMGSRKVAKCMIQNEFEDLGGTVAKATRKRNTCFVVQALNHAAVIVVHGTSPLSYKLSRAGVREIVRTLLEVIANDRARSPCFGASASGGGFLCGRRQLG